MYHGACETGFGCHGSAGTYCITDDIGVGDLTSTMIYMMINDNLFVLTSGSDDGELLMELRSAHAYTSPASAPQGRGDVFVMDSGAGFHVTPHRHMLQAYLEREHPMFPDFFRRLELVCADGDALPVYGTGNIDTGAVRLEDVLLHIPGMVANLVSVRFLNHQIDEQLRAAGFGQPECYFRVITSLSSSLAGHAQWSWVVALGSAMFTICMRCGPDQQAINTKLNGSISYSFILLCLIFFPFLLALILMMSPLYLFLY